MQAVTITQITPQELQAYIIDAVRSCLPKQQPHTEEADTFLNVQQTALFLNVAVPTIYANVSNGQLPALKRGKRLYFSRKQLEQWLLTGKKKTSSDYADEANQFLIHK